MPNEVTVERVVPGGSGLARIDGAVVLVDGGLPGDRLLVEARSDGPRLLRAEVVSVLAPGPHRRPPDAVCPPRAGRGLRRLRLAGRPHRIARGR